MGGMSGAGAMLLFGLLRSRFGILGVIVALVLFFFMGGLGGILPDTEQAERAPVQAAPANSTDTELVQFTSFVLDDAQSTWQKKFAEGDETYRNAKLVLFDQRTSSACGFGSAATGPFYCPRDERVYIDLSFFRELTQRFGAPGDFAQAYVIAHEVGHHVQNVLGTMEEVRRQQTSGNANELSIRLELQADCLAGMWANWVMTHPDQANVESITDEDVREGLNAAAAVGDDRIQEQATGTIDKESWTHGSAEQRMKWFNVGFKQGSLEACDTFAASAL